MAKIKFDGGTYEYDETAVRKYSVIKKMSQFRTNPGGFFEALDVLLCGNADEYAEKLGDDMERISDLFAAIMEQQDGEAKN